MKDTIFIPGNVPSLKNSKQIVKAGKYQKLIPSKTHKKYVADYLCIWLSESQNAAIKLKTFKMPVIVGFYFVRDSKRKFDYDNAISTCQDLMQSSGWIEKDDCEHIKPVALGYHVDKEKPGVFISFFQEFWQIEVPF